MQLSKLRILALSLICAFVSTTSFAQDEDPVYKTTENDFQFRTGWNISKSLSRKFNVEWDQEFRIKDNLGTFDRMYTEIGGSYAILDWLKLQAKYTYILINHDGKAKTNYERYWESRHRGAFGFTLYYKTYSNWRFSLRELGQFTTYEKEHGGYKLYDEGEKANPKWVLKSRLKAEYAFRHIPLTPFISVEFINTLNSPSASITRDVVSEDGTQVVPVTTKYAGNEYFENIRTAIGAEYRFDRRSSIEVYYRFDYEFNKDINIGEKSGEFKDLTEETSYINIIGATYKYRF